MTSITFRNDEQLFQWLTTRLPKEIAPRNKEYRGEGLKATSEDEEDRPYSWWLGPRLPDDPWMKIGSQDRWEICMFGIPIAHTFPSLLRFFRAVIDGKLDKYVCRAFLDLLFEGLLHKVYEVMEKRQELLREVLKEELPVVLVNLVGSYLVVTGEESSGDVNYRFSPHVDHEVLVDWQGETLVACKIGEEERERKMIV